MSRRTIWETGGNRELERQLTQLEGRVDASASAPLRNLGHEVPAAVRPGEFARLRQTKEHVVYLAAPTLADVGKRATFYKTNGEAAVHFLAQACALDGVANGGESAQKSGLIEFEVIPGDAPNLAEWAWVRNGANIFGEMYISVMAATTIALVDTWYLAGGTTTLKDGDLVSMPSDMTLRIDAYGSHEITCAASMSITSASPNRTMRACFGVNGAPQEDTQISRRMASGDVGAFALVGTFEVERLDTIEIYLLNETAASNFTLEYGVITATEAI